MRDYNIYTDFSLNNEGYYVSPVNEVETEDEKFFRDFCVLYSPKKPSDIISIHKKITTEMFGVFETFLEGETPSKFELMLKGLLSMTAHVAFHDLTTFTAANFEKMGVTNVAGVFETLKDKFFKIENEELLFEDNYINKYSSYPQFYKGFKNVFVVYNHAFSIVETNDSKYIQIDTRDFSTRPNVSNIKVALFRDAQDSPYDILKGGFKFLSDLGFPKPNKLNNGLSVGGYQLELIELLKLLYSTILEILDSSYITAGRYNEGEYQQFLEKIKDLLTRINFSFLKFNEIRDLRYERNYSFFNLVKKVNMQNPVPISNFSYHVCNFIKDCLETKGEMFNACELDETYFLNLLRNTFDDMLRFTCNPDIPVSDLALSKDTLFKALANYKLSFRCVEEDGFMKVLFNEGPYSNIFRNCFNQVFPNIDSEQDLLDFVMQGLIKTRFDFFSFKPEEFHCFLKQDPESRNVFLYFYLETIKQP